MAEAHAVSAVQEHLAAFNGHDTPRLLAGFADDVVWITGQDVIRGTAQLEELFDDWLWTLGPSLTIDTVVSDGHHVAAQLTEELTVDGVRQRMSIAAFFVVEAGRITRAKIYREGNADIE